MLNFHKKENATIIVTENAQR